MVNHVFDPSKATLAHLACALGSMEMVSVLTRRAADGHNSIWTQKDDEGNYVTGKDLTAQTFQT